MTVTLDAGALLGVLSARVCVATGEESGANKLPPLMGLSKLPPVIGLTKLELGLTLLKLDRGAATEGVTLGSAAAAGALAGVEAALAGVTKLLGATAVAGAVD